MTQVNTYAVNRLAQELFKRPGLLARFRGEQRAAVYDEYALDAAQRAGMDAGSPDALTTIGVHPILQMHVLLACNPQVARLITVNAYAQWEA